MPSMGHSCRWSVFRAKSQNNEKSNTELELFELGTNHADHNKKARKKDTLMAQIPTNYIPVLDSRTCPSVQFLMTLLYAD